MRTPTNPLLFLVAVVGLQTIRRADAQPTLRSGKDDRAEYGPPDRFTEGTKIKTLFEQIDANGDKKLDRTEVDAYFQKQGAAVSDGLWDDEDKNGDGFIEIHEFARGNPGDEL